MARPRYRLHDQFYDQGVEHHKKTTSGMSASGCLYQAGQEIEFDGPPSWCMEALNDEAAAMIEKYPPEPPMTVDQMVEASPNPLKDANDRNVTELPELSSRRSMDKIPEGDLPKARRGRPPKSVVAAALALFLLFSPLTAKADINAGQANSVYSGNGYGNEATWKTSPTINGLTVNGHVQLTGSVPALSSCGTSPSVSGTDQKGVITTGGGAPTACTLTFGTAFGTTPVCSVEAGANVTAYISAISTTAVTFTLSATATNLYYICVQ